MIEMGRIRRSINEGNTLQLALLIEGKGPEFMNEVHPLLRYKSLLMYAISVEKEEIANFLLVKNVDINIKDKNNWTALHYAVELEMKDLVKSMIDMGADIHSYNGWTPLHMAYDVGSYTCVQMLTNKGADLRAVSIEGKTMLHWAVQWGWVDDVIYLLSQGLNPNAKDADGHTPLHKACYIEHKKIAELLVDAGGDMGIYDKHGDTPLSYARGSVNYYYFASLAE